MLKFCVCYLLALVPVVVSFLGTATHHGVHLRQHLVLQEQTAKSFTTVVKEELLEIEYALFLRSENPITTLTWFRGDVKSAYQFLEDRLEQILHHNRWLGGRIIPENNKVFLTFKPEEPLNTHDFLTMVDPTESPIRRRTPLDRLARDCKELVLSNGPREPLFRVTLVPCRSSPKTHFAVLLALSHIIADGHTYYRIMSMLCGNDDTTTIEPLIYERISTTATQQAAAVGQPNYDFFARPGPAFFINYFGGFVKSRTIGPVNQCVFALVDEGRMKNEKAQAVARSGDSVKFVSTNDVLTSWFLQTTQADIGAMAINFRNRLRGHSDRHAGNYESIIVYNPKDSASPALIRKSLDNLRRVETIQNPLPSSFDALGLRNCIVTNWSSFAKPNIIPGCQEELHIPLYDPAPLVPSNMAALIIFRSGPKGTGVFMTGSPDALKELGYSRQFQKRPSFLSTEPLL